MFSEYFDGWDVKSGYEKEFVSLWSGWLGQDNYHKLDEVTEDDWARFNNWIRRLATDFTIEVVDCESQSLTKVEDIETILPSYTESMNKDSSSFLKLVLPELGCMVTEEWDYTFIIWHKNNGAIEALSPYIKSADLKHFHG